MGKTTLFRQKVSPFFWGSLVGIMGGLIGLGGAEFRLPILINIFKYRTLQAIIINLVVSLVTVTFSLIFRSGITGFSNVTNNLPIIFNILAGSLLGSYIGVNYATRINDRALNKVVVIFLIFISFILMGHELIFSLQTWQLPSLLKIITALVAGIVIGVFSSLLGVAGGELIIPTIILIFAVDIKIAGSLSLAISIPTILMGLFKYNRQGKLQEIKSEKFFLIMMGMGSIVGAFIGSYLLNYISSSFLYWILGIILLISAFKLAKH
ncbi:MAG: sulfite exporter TauE/SafE family protein [Gomphosphaeria aponina SAG 52.96 = DSM 107014]|uniref:Probable membrane transporter protein n=1 Tax=Gomphosphaeria aponina SAG 52.96 = DSM 107014 TaxID=1521640 RepID=A0A941GWG9_9CHRO|nr:sulfite exporter TauE/SafE family protein [Gomphosphaeria aponina SAG 52.96 = DSM 107014]